MSNRLRWGAPALLGMFVLLAATPAAATPDEEDGLWYFDWFKVQDAHDSGVTGEGVTIAMIDGPVNLGIPTLADGDIRVQDAVCVRADGSRPVGESTDYQLAEHGTSVLSLLVGSGEGFPGQTGVKGVAPGATVLTYHVQLADEPRADEECPGVTFSDGFSVIGTSNEIALSMHAAMDAGADIISISMAVSGSAHLDYAVARAVQENVIVVAGQPNEGDIWMGDAPGRSNGVVAVNHSAPDGDTHGKDHTDVTAPGASILVQGAGGDWEAQRLSGGTSLATPIVSGNLALAMQKYPDATPNQLIQSLIHNTGAEPHDLMWDALYGYGVVITDVFLAADPTAYPDIHPLVYNFADVTPYVDLIWPGAVRSTQNTPPTDRPWPAYDPHLAAPQTTPDAEPSDEGNSGSTPAATISSTPKPDEPESASAGWLIPGVIAGVVLLVAVGIIIAIVAIRSNRPTGGPHGTQ